MLYTASVAKGIAAKIHIKAAKLPSSHPTLAESVVIVSWRKFSMSR